MLDNPIDLKALNFFDVTINCYKVTSKINLLNKKYLLPSFSSLLNEEEFAKVYVGWSPLAIFFLFDIDINFSNFNEDFRKGDSIEIFIDTRCLKTKGYLTKFCHHFVIYSEGQNRAEEITRFRQDEMHPLADSKTIEVESIVKPNSAIVNVSIPSISLFGYNPNEISSFSFSYRINRKDLPPQNFSISSFEHLIEKSSHLWVKMNLKE